MSVDAEMVAATAALFRLKKADNEADEALNEAAKYLPEYAAAEEVFGEYKTAMEHANKVALRLHEEAGEWSMADQRETLDAVAAELGDEFAEQITEARERLDMATKMAEFAASLGADVPESDPTPDASQN